MRAARLGLVIVVMVLLQVTVFPHLRIAGVAPDLGLLVAIAVGYTEGPEAGALTGFAAGFAFDLFLETPMGLNALAYALVGYAAGLFEAGLFRSPRWLPTVMGFLGGLASGLVVIGVGVLVGLDSVKGAHGVETVLVAAVYDALLAPFVFFLVTRTLGAESGRSRAWSAR